MDRRAGVASSPGVPAAGDTSGAAEPRPPRGGYGAAGAPDPARCLPPGHLAGRAPFKTMPGAKYVYVEAPQPRASSCLWGCPQRWLAAMGPRLAPPLGTPLAPRGLGEDPWHRLTLARAGSRSLPGALGQSAGETLRAVTAHGLDPSPAVPGFGNPSVASTA